MARQRTPAKRAGDIPPARSRPRAKPQQIPGWEKLPGTAKQYRGPDGKTYSERYYRRNVLHGGVTNESYAHARNAPNKNYNRLIRARQAFLEKTTGKKPSLSAIKSSDEMRQIVAQVRKAKNASAARGPDSALARALVDLGYRDPNAKYLVGETPDKGEAGYGAKRKKKSSAKSTHRKSAPGKGGRKQPVKSTTKPAKHKARR